MPGTNTNGPGDNGALFADAGSTASILGGSGGASGAVDASRSEGGSGIPGDGNMATATIGGYKAIFTQKGTDVTLLITAGQCAAGTHKIEVHEGFACDDPTKGPVWGGKRGTGINNAASTFTCDGKSLSVTYTRTGDDPATNWTVGDHNATTDVTQHPILVDQQCGTFF